MELIFKWNHQNNNPLNSNPRSILNFSKSIDKSLMDSTRSKTGDVLAKDVPAVMRILGIFYNRTRRYFKN